MYLANQYCKYYQLKVHTFLFVLTVSSSQRPRQVSNLNRKLNLPPGSKEVKDFWITPGIYVTKNKEDKPILLISFSKCISIADRKGKIVGFFDNGRELFGIYEYDGTTSVPTVRVKLDMEDKRPTKMEPIEVNELYPEHRKYFKNMV